MDRLMRDGVTIAFEDVGRGAPPILLVHDPAIGRTALTSHLLRLRSSHRVVVPDLRARDHAGAPDTGCAPAEAADDLAWLCYELGVYRPVAVGFRAGGLIVVEIVKRFPGLLAAAVTVDAADEEPARADALLEPVLAELAAPDPELSRQRQGCVHGGRVRRRAG